MNLRIIPSAVATSVAALVLLSASAATAATEGIVDRPWREHGTGMLDASFDVVQLQVRIAHLGAVTDTGTSVIAANGDEVFYELVGEGDGGDPDEVCDAAARRASIEYGMPMFSYEQTFEFVGGTGRFDGATGTTTSRGCVVPIDDVASAFFLSFVSEGTISY